MTKPFIMFQYSYATTVKDPIHEIAETLKTHRFAVLTGAGVSTESGIPDYRGPETKHIPRNPITFQEFSKDRANRRRYWARARFGWPKIRDAAPNASHMVLAALEARGLVTSIITQNVDRLHQKAGSEEVIELHGALEEVVCLSCKEVTHRETLQTVFDALNPDQVRPQVFAPDGDSVVAQKTVEDFRLPTCHCGGDFKPNVVFFGENVAPDIRDSAFDVVDDSEALLIVGTSLQVYSGLRYVKHAAKARKPIFAINLGPTRGDEYVWTHCDRVASTALRDLASLI